MRCNRRKLAALLGKDVKTVDKMVGQGMPFVRKPGTEGSRSWEFDTRAVLGWLRGEMPELDEKLREARTRLLVAEAEIRTMEYLERLGILHNLNDITPRFEEALIDVRTNFYNIPSRLSQLVAYETEENKILALLQREVEAALEPLVAFRAEIESSAALSRQRKAELEKDPVLAKLFWPSTHKKSSPS